MNGVDKPKSTNISLQEFNDYFVKSVDEIKSNIGVTQISPLVLLQNKMIERDIFAWREVTYDDVLTVVNNMKDSKTRYVYDMSNNFINHK